MIQQESMVRVADNSGAKREEKGKREKKARRPAKKGATKTRAR